MTTSGFDANGDLGVDRANDPAAVTAIQEALRDLHYKVEVTGVYDALTAAKVRDFKHNQKLTSPGALTDDGVAGPGTMRRLDEIFAPLSDAAADVHRTPTPLPFGRRTGDGEFLIKRMDGAAAALGVGLFIYTFVIWDRARAEAGVFNYTGYVASGGVSNPFSGESDWVGFDLDSTARIDRLSGDATHRMTTAVIGERFTLEVTPRHAPGFVVHFDGLTLGVGLQAGAGPFRLDSAGVRPFDGET